MGNLDKKCWYWFTDPREGDVWYPCYVMESGQIRVDGWDQDPKLFKDLIFRKAVMPEDPCGS